MREKLPLRALGIHTATDLCALDSNPPPLSFAKDFYLSPNPPTEVSYKSPPHHTACYLGSAPGWAP